MLWIFQLDAKVSLSFALVLLYFLFCTSVLHFWIILASRTIQGTCTLALCLSFEGFSRKNLGSLRKIIRVLVQKFFCGSMYVYR